MFTGSFNNFWGKLTHSSSFWNKLEEQKPQEIISSKQFKFNHPLSAIKSRKILDLTWLVNQSVETELFQRDKPPLERRTDAREPQLKF